jgi:hypothetical protein
VELAAHILLVPRLGTSGVMHPPPTNMPSWPAEGRIYFVPFVVNVNKAKTEHIMIIIIIIITINFVSM